ncbi:MAG: TIGR04255 family protein [Syntrophales bacterium]|nr:TIGR04255 family protein [Syntrophales bacterium]
MSSQLPIKLTAEPLIDAVFEMRFKSSVAASNILPGIFFKNLEGEKKIEQLGAASVPKEIRDNDSNLQYTPLTRIFWGNFIILIGDASFGIACKLPYPGWNNFKEFILKATQILVDVGTIQNVYRYSMKYVDIIPSARLQDQISSVKLKVQIGEHKLEKENIQIRIEIPRTIYIQAVQIMSSVKAESVDKKIISEGLVIDIDTICNLQDEKFDDFLTRLEDKLEDIHTANKEMFFSCLTAETLERLGPIYE